jgi:hypothetical protein
LNRTQNRDQPELDVLSNDVNSIYNDDDGYYDGDADAGDDDLVPILPNMIYTYL